MIRLAPMPRTVYLPPLALAVLLLAAAAVELPSDDDVCRAGASGCGASEPGDRVDLMQLRSRVKGKKRVDLKPPHLGIQRHFAGVPVYNYHLAYPSGAEPSAVELET